MLGKKVKQQEIAKKEIHQEAEVLLEKIVSEYGAAVLLQARILAYQRGFEVVSKNHIQEALEKLRNNKEEKWWQNFLLLLGGTLLGTFAQGFITELQKSKIEPLWVAIYVALGFIGILCVFTGYFRR